jgi:hypothetical protein
MIQILKYIFFLVLGIIIFIVYNSVDNFSVGIRYLQLGQPDNPTDLRDYDENTEIFFTLEDNVDTENPNIFYFDPARYFLVPGQNDILITDDIIDRIIEDNQDNPNFEIIRDILNRPRRNNRLNFTDNRRNRNSGISGGLDLSNPDSGIGGLGLVDQPPPGGGGGMSGRGIGSSLVRAISSLLPQESDNECAAKRQKKLYNKMINLYSYLDFKNIQLNGARYSIYSLECPYSTSISDTCDFHFFIAIEDPNTGHIITIGYGSEVESNYGITSSGSHLSGTDPTTGTFTILDTYTSDFFCNGQGLLPNEEYNKVAMSNLEEFSRMLFSNYESLTQDKKDLLTTLGLNNIYWDFSYYNLVVDNKDVYKSNTDIINALINNFMTRYDIFSKKWDELTLEEKTAIQTLTNGLINNQNWDTRKYEISHPYTNGCKIRKVVDWGTLSEYQKSFLQKIKDISNPISKTENLGLQVRFRNFEAHSDDYNTNNVEWINGNSFSDDALCLSQCTDENNFFSCLEGSLFFHSLRCDNSHTDISSILDELTEFEEIELEEDDY